MALCNCSGLIAPGLKNFFFTDV